PFRVLDDLRLFRVLPGNLFQPDQPRPHTLQREHRLALYAAPAFTGIEITPGCHPVTLFAFNTAEPCRTSTIPSAITNSASLACSPPGAASTSHNPTSSSITSDAPSTAATSPASLSFRPCSAARRARLSARSSGSDGRASAIMDGPHEKPRTSHSAR